MTGGQFIRVLKRKEVVALALGAMIGWSWVALTGTWIIAAGSAGAMLAFLVGGTTVVLVGLTYAELASAMPRAGGEHVYSYRALGPTASFICTWAILLGYVSVVAFEAVALPTVINYLMPGFSRGYLWTIAGWDVEFTWVLVGAVAAFVMTAINVIGIKAAAKLQLLVTTMILIAGLLLIGGAAVGGSSENMMPLVDHGMKGFLGVLVMVPFMFVGFDVIPQSAEEMRIPLSDIGRMLMFSILMAVIWYVGIIAAVSMGLSAAERVSSELPTADAISALFGSSWAGKLLIVAGVGGILTSWNAFLIGGSRAIYAMAQSGQLPRSLGALHVRYGTPYNAVMLIGALSVLAPLFGRPALVWLVNAGSFGIIVAYAFVALSFLALHTRDPGMRRPFEVQHWRFVGTAALVLSIGIACLFLPGSQAALVWPHEWLIVIGWIALGLQMMWFARK